ncbi:MAG: RES family NAD+ phosphorylase [Acidimicrobiales bacterium]
MSDSSRPSGLPTRRISPPERETLRAGTKLYRIHDRNYRADAFKTSVVDAHFGGGRFDSTLNAVYPYLYAAPEPGTVIAETLLRGLPFDPGRSRILPNKTVSKYCFSEVELAEDVTLLSLCTMRGLLAVGQTGWLVQCEQPEYPFTRRVGHWLRDQAPWAQGFVWLSKRNQGERSMILFGDRFPAPQQPGGVTPIVRQTAQPSIDFADDAGITWLNDRLAQFRMAVRSKSH